MLWLLACTACVLSVLGFQVGVAFAQESVSAGSVSSSSFGGPLDAAGQLLGSEPVANAEEAERQNPSAVAERATSRTQYAGLGRDAAVALAEKVFHIERPSWTAPGSAGEGRISKYLGETSAVEEASDGERLLVASSVPLRSAVGSGRLAPTSLALREQGGAFLPANPVVPISISKSPGDGVSLPLGVSAAPVQAAAPEAPITVGDRVVYPGTATDTDFMVQAIPAGVETSWQLRSERSSGDDGLIFKLPAGASLRASTSIVGGAEIALQGQALALIPPAVATEADGTALATSYAISGDTLTTHVDLSGSVAFPVMVDPIIIGGFGSSGAGAWTGWTHSDNCSGCTIAKETSSLLEVGMNPGPANGTEGQWYIWAPGAGKEGGASIERVDLSGVAHQASGQSYFVGYIYKSNGSKRVWTFNGTEGAQGEGALFDGNALAGSALAFCAQGAGGKDGGVQPLCNENYGGEAFALADELGPNGRTTYNYSAITGASVRFLDTTAPNEATLYNISEKWSKNGPNTDYIRGEDQGVGVEALTMEIPPGHLNEHGQPFFADNEFEGCASSNGFDGCYLWIKSKDIEYNELATGAYTLGVYAYDAAGNVREEKPDPKLYIDHTPPVVSLSGPLQKASGGAIGEGDYELDFISEDGSTSAPQSGVRTVTVYVDGTKVHEASSGCAEPVGVPSRFCIDVSGSWMFSGQKYGAGSHTIAVTARDWVGNETTETIHVTVNTASYQPLGPGAVNLSTGDYRLSAMDVSMAGANSTLSVGRTYDSRNVSQGSVGPLGAPWSLNLPDSAASSMWQSLRPMPSGSIVATTNAGTQVTFASDGKGGFVSPTGYQTEYLSEISKSPVEYKIVEPSGAATIFTFAGTVQEPKGEEETEEVSLYEPTGVVQPGGTNGINKVTYLFTKTSEGIVEPTEVLAPEPTTGSCTSLVKGCRALTFNYASSTTATGENESGWGDYKGRLTRVYFTAWNPAKNEMATTTVAQYSYDSRGRLRAVWDPRVSPELKTLYGYDAEGHITSVTAPGQESWAFTYGTIGGDPVTGRLLAATQAPASAPLWNGEALKSTEEPTITGSAIFGNRMSVSTGKWSAPPVAYSYQWEDCDAHEKECTAILGATNATYKPVESDGGHTLSVIVTATNGGGSATVTVAETVRVGKTFEPVYSTSFGSEGTGNGQFQWPVGIAVDSKGNIWVADSANDRIEEFNEKYEYVGSFGSAGSGNGQFKDPEGIAISSGNNIWVADYANHRVQEFNEKGEYLRQVTGGTFAYEKLESPSGVAVNGTEIWVTDTTKNNMEAFSETGAYLTYWGRGESGANELRNPRGVAFVGGLPWVADSSNNRVIGYGSEGELGHELESIGQIGDLLNGSGAGELNYPMGVTSDSKGDLWIVDTENDRIQEFGEIGSSSHYITQFGKFGSGAGAFIDPEGVAIDSKGNILVTDTRNNRIEKWTPSTETIKEGAIVPAAPPRWTVEYRVPTQGGGAPHQLTEPELTKWAQKDEPAESMGTAIFPPDETQAWPASDYRRATIYYLDSAERTVNVATPSGGISTIEYDTHNNQTRTLTAANRAAALKEAKTAEAAEHLSTTLSYNAEGTELTGTLGPEHKVKLPSGSEVQARKQVTYSYDEGAPGEGGPYRLVTKTTEAALTAGKEEDKRTVTNSYAGQENLGWKLRKPTSTAVAPEGLNLKHTIVYSATTGDGLETTMPAASATGQISEYALPSGSSPYDIASGPDGNLWFTDYGTGEVGKITTGGVVTKYAADPDEPEGIAAGPDGNLWFVEHLIRHVNHMTTGGSLTVYTLTRTNTNNVGIVAGSDGNLWFTESATGYVGKMNTKDEVLGEYALPSGSKPYGIAAGPDKNLWVAEYSTGEIAKITTSGTITEYSLPAGSEPYGIAAGPDGNLWFTDHGTGKVGKITTSGTITEYSLPSGSEPASLTAGGEGNLWVAEYGTSKIAKVTTSGGIVEYGLPPASKPQGIALGSDGNVWFTEEGTNKIGKIGTALGNPGAYTSQTIYYTPGTEASVAACQNHPEWAGLPCQTQPAHQPEVGGLPEIPLTIFTYNVWDEPETTRSTSGESTRTEADTYDAAGRPTSKETTSTTGTSLPKVSYQYNSETGLPTAQSTGSGSEEKRITSEYNKLGQMTGYTDADGATTTFEYEKEADDRLTKTADPKGIQTLKYDEMTGSVKELTDSAAGTFTAKYDVEGNLEAESLPNGMNLSTTRNSVGEATGLEYTKTTHCTENCKWFTDSVVPSIHGQWMSQTSTLSTNAYAYDEVGRLVQVQDSPVGKGCATRIYGLEADGNRVSLTKRAPETGGGCAGSGGEVEYHTYDTADRLIDAGISYNPFGDVTTLPASDAGGSELTSTYYTDGQLATQTQEGQTIGYNLDPARRTRETVATGKRISDITNHYDGPGTTPSWMAYTSGETTRDIGGIADGLAAVQYNGETPVLQVANLHGDIIATVPDSETATKLTSAIDTTEFGVPTTAEPPKYSWLGAGEFPTELASGTIDIGARSYVPQLGRFLQPDPQPGGSANAYAYTHGNPLNEADPSGEWTLGETSGGVSAVGVGEGVQLAGGTGIAAGAIMPAEVNTQIEEAFWAAPPWDQVTAGAEEYEEYEEEEGEEYAAYHQGTGQGEAYTEEGLLYQPLNGERGGVASETRTRLAYLCEKELHNHSQSGSDGACARYVSLLGEIEGGLKKVGSVIVKGARLIVRGAKYIGNAEIRGAETVYRFMVHHAHKPGAVGIACAAAGAALPFVASNPFTISLGVGLAVGCALYS